MMNLRDLVGLVFLASEVALLAWKRSRGGSADKGTLRLLWVVIGAAIALGYVARTAAPSLGFADRFPAAEVGAALFAAGIALRAYSIAYLGKFFTVDVAISDDHRVVDTGPYRHVRHPSYSGCLLEFLGLGVCLGNAASVLLLTVPTAWVFLRRIQVEEQALLSGLGEPYGAYIKRTRKLIPGVY